MGRQFLYSSPILPHRGDDHKRYALCFGGRDDALPEPHNFRHEFGEPPVADFL